MGEGTYLRLKRLGYTRCKVVEERDFGTRKAGEVFYGNLAVQQQLAHDMCLLRILTPPLVALPHTLSS